MATAIQTVLITAGSVTFLLAVAGPILARPVAQGNALARWAAFGLAAAAVCGGLGSMSYTAFGQHVDWAGTSNAERGALRAGRAGVRRADAGLAGRGHGGLTDLQALGYIAVAILLALPVVAAVFSRAERPRSEPEPER